MFFKINSSNRFPEDGCISKSHFIQLDALQACPLIAAQQRPLLAESGASLRLAPLGGQWQLLHQCSVVAIFLFFLIISLKSKQGQRGGKVSQSMRLLQ